MLEQVTCVRLAEHRGNGDIPQPRIRELRAFYGILLRHEDRQIIRERQIARRKRMMVRKRVLDDIETPRPEVAKEARRIADASHGVQAPPPELLEGLRLALAIEPESLACNQTHL
jgi:hypothetical protein